MSDEQTKVKVWDAPVRLFHWSLVGLVALSWWAAEEGEMDIHLWSGLTVLTLVIFRILWGLFGSDTARFSQFLAKPTTVIDYARGIMTGTNQTYAGHNPTGGWAVVMMLLVLAFQTSTGLFSNDDILFRGPLAYMVDKDMSDTLTGLHKTAFNGLLALVILHVAAVLFYKFIKRDDLIKPMLSGHKNRDQVPPNTKVMIRNPIVAILLLAISAAFVWWLIK